jgi:cellulose synthase/poly-beta-1,6-N-acetylglucosamine synthase-like glycosyltransferase
MLVHADIIKENNGLPYRGLTEDYEMTADAIIKGWSSMYYSHAKVYTEEATDRKSAYMRKLRWIKGYSQCSRRYRKKMPWRNIDWLYSTHPPYAFFGVSAVAMLCGLAALCFSLFGASVSLTSAVRLTLIPLSLVYGSLFVYTLLALIVDWRNIKIPLHEKLAVLFLNPLYTLGYLRIFIAAFATDYDYFKWQATERVPFEAEHHIK